MTHVDASRVRQDAVRNLGVLNTTRSAAWPSDSESRYYDGRDRKVDDSIPTQASLLRPWIKCFTTIISAC